MSEDLVLPEPGYVGKYRGLPGEIDLTDAPGVVTGYGSALVQYLADVKRAEQIARAAARDTGAAANRQASIDRIARSAGYRCTRCGSESGAVESTSQGGVLCAKCVGDKAIAIPVQLETCGICGGSGQIEVPDDSLVGKVLVPGEDDEEQE